jgi:hypothetical protein
MTTLDEIAGTLAQIRATLEGLQPDHSPWLRGDESAARFAGYQSRKAFRAWAKESGIRPSVDGGLNFWSRADINKARERGKR